MGPTPTRDGPEKESRRGGAGRKEKGEREERRGRGRDASGTCARAEHASSEDASRILVCCMSRVCTCGVPHVHTQEEKEGGEEGEGKERPNRPTGPEDAQPGRLHQMRGRVCKAWAPHWQGRSYRVHSGRCGPVGLRRVSAVRARPCRARAPRREGRLPEHRAARERAQALCPRRHAQPPEADAASHPRRRCRFYRTPLRERRAVRPDLRPPPPNHA